MSTKKKLPSKDKVEVRVNFSYVYDHKGKRIAVSKDEILLLLNKTNEHWWKCRRPGEKSFYVPALYVSSIDEDEDEDGDEEQGLQEEPEEEPSKRRKNFEFDGDLEYDGDVQEGDNHQKQELTDEDNLKTEDDEEENHNVYNNNENHNHDDDEKYKKQKNDNCQLSLIENDGEKIRIRTSMNVSSDLDPEDENQSLTSIPSAIVPDIQYFSPRLQNDRLLAHSDTSSTEDKKSLTKKQYWSDSLEELSSQIVFPGQPSHLCFRNPTFPGFSTSNISKSDSSIKLSREENLDSLVSSKEEQTPKLENLIRTLPNHWGEYKCPTTSRIFYYNSNTKSTSWKPPRISKEDNNNVFNVPSGWTQLYDDTSGTVSFINQATGAKWFTSTDPSGKIYFYEENSSKSSWFLPAEEVVAGGQAPASSASASASSTNLQHQRLESISSGDSSEVDLTRPFPKRNFSGDHLEFIVERGSKTRSLLILDSKRHDEALKSSSLPRQSSIWKDGKLSPHETIYENYLNRTKLTEHGKKVRKNWATSWAVLTRTHLTFFKDQKALTADHIKSDMELELVRSRVEWASDKSSKKYVFLMSCPTLQLLCQSNSEVEAEKWFEYISKQINNQPEDDEIRYHLKASSPPKNSNEYGELYTGDGTFRPQRRNTTKSFTKLRITSTKDDDKNQIRNQLKKFFIRRQSRDSLIKKGIYKDEPVFGCTLEKLTQLEGTTVPIFVETCIDIIESKLENMKTDGIYRASGNLSQVQKIRLQVDQNNLQILHQEDDVHVLAGSLKLFFREMREPVVPSSLFQGFLRACHVPQKEEKLKKFRELIQQLPRANFDTLKRLLQHLLNVSSYSEYNRMQIPNLAIVFGPTVMWNNSESNICMAADLMQQNYIVEILLTDFHTLFH